MSIGSDFKEILGGVRRAEKKADDALKTSGEAMGLAKQAKGDVTTMRSMVNQAYNCGQEVRGKQEKMEKRIQQIEISGGVRPAADVWLKLGVVAFGSAAAGMLIVAFMVKVL